MEIPEQMQQAHGFAPLGAADGPVKTAILGKNGAKVYGVQPPVQHADASPALRALFVVLEEWVTKGVAPPPSRVPSIAAGTAVTAEAVKMPAVPGFAVAPGANRIAAPVDWVDPPARPDNVYGTRVCAVDADGNEIAGIRLPPIAVPLGTYTGWNVYRAQPCELCDRDGSLIPFARTLRERAAIGDPRPSLEERYGSRDAYVAKVKAAAEALVADRLLLPSDAALYIKAAENYDRLNIPFLFCRDSCTHSLRSS
jgi:hypothetical protein